MKVLVIDDSPVTRKMVQRMISSVYPNATFAEAKDGDEALDVIDEQCYDLYTIDYNMPGANGEIVAIAAKTKSPRAKICMLTSDKGDSTRRLAERIGVKYLTKPNFEQDLLAFIKS
ncbi:MAG: response regulator transcription factor [Aestuariibacter sp.]